MDVFALDDDAPPLSNLHISAPDEHIISPASQLPHQRRHSTSRTVNIDLKTELNAQKRRVSDFFPLKVLGVGAYGKVLLVRDTKTNKLYAQKQLKKATIVVEERMVSQTKSERQILESVRHPYIVRLHYAVQDQQKLYLILQYAPGGELFTHLAAARMFSEDCAAYYGAQAASALCHLHNQGILYRDLKPENCLLDAKGNLLLTDFGLSKIAENDATCNSMLGTPEYMAPEVLLGESYDYSVDWWSFGALLYDFMTGNPPFTGANKDRVIKKIVGQKYKPALPYYLSLDAKDLIRKLLRKEPQRRLGFKQMEVIKKHRFFRKINWKQIEECDPSLNPPIKPILTDPVLAENFNDEFTSMVLSPPIHSQAPTSSHTQLTVPSGSTAIRIPEGPLQHDLFMGFSYTGSLTGSGGSAIL